MNIHFSAPSKTFLAGEYAVLKGGPGLVLNTAPRFELKVQRGTGTVEGIPEGCPAWTWIEQNKPLLNDWNLEFLDPHAGRGGFGASSAQFLFVHALTSLFQASVSRAAEGLDVRAVLADFKTLSGGQASGSDILAQATGGVTRVISGATAALAWPYPDLDFLIVRTGVKVATHTHLAELNRESLTDLVDPAIAVIESFGAVSISEFLDQLRAFSLKLRALGLQAPQVLLEETERQPWCKLAKGCGAMGADTLLVFFALEDKVKAQEYFAVKGLEVIASAAEISPGLDMKWSWS